MGLTGKYDFQGIKKAGAAGIKVALASTAFGAWFVKSPFSVIIDLALELFANWLANNGLVVFNLGAILVDGSFDQNAFDKALLDGLQNVELGRDKISPEQGRAIDDEVRKAAQQFISFIAK